MTKIFKDEDSVSLKRKVNQWELDNINNYNYVVIRKQYTEYSGIFYCALHISEV